MTIPDSRETNESNGSGRELRRNQRQRRREQGAERRGLVVLLPHVATTANLAAGFFAIIMASSGHIERAAFAIVLAGVFDGLDGRLARMARSASRFGTEYDSIADTVSFGVAPAILAWNAGHLYDLGWSGWVMAFTYTACAALRLARFNVSPGRWPGRFEGLPSPAAAGMLLATTLFGVFLNDQGVTVKVPASLLGLGVACVGLLMVSQIPYHSFKNIRFERSHRTVVMVVIGFTLILLQPGITLFLIGIVYLSSGPVEWLWRWHRGLPLAEAEEGEESLPDMNQGTPQ